MKRFFATLLAVVMLISMIPAASMAAQYATVVGGWLRLRAGASFEADTITSYYTDTVVEILGNSGNWYRVKTPDGRTGYMYGDYLKLGASGSSTANAYVTSHNGYGVRLRKGPGTGYRVIRTYAVGTPVTVLESGTYWSRISINGTIGYMMSQFLSTHAAGGNGNESVLCYATIWSNNGYGVRLRTGPSKSYGKIGVYSVGTSVAVLEKGTTWDRIRVGSRTGWMMNEFLVYQNANELTSVTLNTFKPTVGTVMKVKAMSPSDATVSYAWLVDGMVRGSNATYTVSEADVGKTIQLKVNGTGKYTGSAVSKVTEKVISNTQISGLKLNTTAPVVGDVLKAEITPAEASVNYAWKVNGYQVSTESSYAVKAEDVGKKIELIVTGKGNYSGVLSASTAAVAASSQIASVAIRNDSNTTVGAIPMVGDTLTAVINPAQATATYQWYRSGSAISGATSASYTLTEADQGEKMSVTVKGTGAYGGEKSASISDSVAARPEKPSIDDYAMPEAMVGKTYATQLTAQGGGEIRWALAADAKLPDGLTLSESGAITGTPAKEGSFTFAVKASNVTGSDEKSFTITVVPVAKPELTVGSVTFPAQTVGYEQPSPAAVSITNIGKADAVLELLWTEGSNADSFVVNENGGTIIPAGATDQSWTVQPVVGLGEGTYTADLVVRYDDGATVSAKISFTVNAQSSEPVPENSYTITVNGGTADKASAKAGETVSITANAAEDGNVFAAWTSNEVSFADASAAATTFTMPEADVTVTANYTTVVPPEVQNPELTIKDIVLPDEEEGYAQPAPYTVEITNIGNGDATLKLLYPEGGNASAFTVNQDGSTIIAAGATDTTWTIQPAAGLSAGIYTTEFVAEYDGTQSRANVSFTVKEKAPVKYNLTVEDGSGSGAYSEGEAVTVSANGAEDGMVFAGWNASAGSIADSSSSETTFTMPAGDAVVTAAYKAKEKAKLASPVITWSEDGTSVSWTAVEGADTYKYYRVKADGTETSKSKTSETSYVFQNPGISGDVFYVKAIDTTGTYADGDYASAAFE